MTALFAFVIAAAWAVCGWAAFTHHDAPDARRETHRN